MTYTLIGAAVAGLGYAFAALLTKRALVEGAGVLRLAFVMNMVFFPVFAVTLPFGPGPVEWSLVHWPLLAGVFFFAGQVFTFAAIRFGDVSLQTPLMGTKVVFVVLFGSLFGVGTIDGSIWTAGFLSTVGVALLGLSGKVHFNHAGLTLVLSIASAFTFAGADTLIGAYADAFDPKLFIVLMIAVTALLSFGLLPFFSAPLSAIPRRAWLWLLAGSFAMAVQALILNLTLAYFGEIAVANIVYSTRGLWSVLLAAPAAVILALPKDSGRRSSFVLRFAGALLMTASVVMVFV